MDDIGYVEMYAERLREDKRLFGNHKRFIEAQINGSKSLFSNMFPSNFKSEAREFLRKRGLL